jgi:DNA polymerase-3 subunit epsilon
MNEFITIDFETAVYSHNSAISIGLVKYRDFEVIDTYYSLIRPPILRIRRDFTDIHGLTVDDVRDAPKFNQLWDSAILPFIGQTTLAAHNAQFDMSILSAVLEHYNLPIPQLRYFCTLHLARKTWPGLSSHALTALAANFGIVYNAHNALDDALTCGKLVQIAAQKYGTGNDVEGLLKAAGVGMRGINCAG